MLSRRRFMRSSGLGVLSLSGLCYPAHGGKSENGNSYQTSGLNPVAGERHKDQLLGYPINMKTPPAKFFAWREELLNQGIGEFAHNNVGNPYKPSPIPYSTHDYERKIIRSFGKVYGFPANDTWGFLSHSGTDSNMHGMYMGRTILKGRTGKLPKAYFTRETHYSVQILSDLLGLEHEMVGTLADGGMDPDDLAIRLGRNREVPALLVPTIGTTFKGAIDDLDSIQAQLTGHESYVHLDAALFGGYLPFTSDRSVVAFDASRGEYRGRYDSIAISCHKFFGFPNPAGLFVTRQSLYDEFSAEFSKVHNPEYIHQVPGTITCSRDAAKPAEFYYFTKPEARKSQIRDAHSMLENSKYLLGELTLHFPSLSPKRANVFSNTIYFRNPGDAIVKKYSLATMKLADRERTESYAHVVVMPHVTRGVLDEFLSELDIS